ncbi:MAG: response regulator transcription factor [Kordia sp.]|uniref:response regulator transcription factor n=1 Tax=Kordia sp. TaxID=1965332 RepID=UPI00385D613D
MNKIIRIAIVDDDKLFAQLLSDLLSEHEDMKVVFTAHERKVFMANYEQKNIDVVLLDLRMDDGIGLSVLRELQIRSEAIKTIVLSKLYTDSLMAQILRLGASAFLPKDTSEEELIRVIQKVFKKGHYFSRDQMEFMRLQLSEKIPEIYNQKQDSLTVKEIEILKLLSKQYTSQQIGERLYISLKTVEAHKRNLLRKTGAKNTAGLLIYAIQNKIIDTDELLFLN